MPYQERQDDVTSRPLRLLYAGTITQRKGIKYLLEAVKRLPKQGFELHLIGGIQGSGKALQSYQGWYQYHSPISQMELFQRYNYFDAMVLPTVFEGFGLVILEAMAAGLPVITTPNSIGPELIGDGENGYIVPIRDVEALYRAMEQLRAKDKEQYQQMRLSARKSANQYTWDNYTVHLQEILYKYFSN